jgi:uncharacterized membrane protein YhaH (DUF805 family)
VRGEVLSYDDVAGQGLISGDDGTRYSFSRSELQQLTPLRPGMRVDFVGQGTVATGVILLADTPSHVARPDNDRTTAWGYFKRCIGKYADGTGRARRKEYWYFVLFQLLILIGPLTVLMVFAGLAGDAPDDDPVMVGVGLLAIVVGLMYLFFVLPGIAVMIRRFHDVGLSGWLVLLGLIPYLGGLITFIITLLPSEARPNKHGPVPGQATRSTADVFT